MARSVKKSAKLSFRRVRVQSPSIRFKPDSSSIERDQRIEFLSGGGGGEGDNLHEEYEEEEEGNSFTSGGESGSEEAEASAGNRVMVVVDRGLAPMGALEWALTHTLQSQDTLFLLYFSRPSRKGKKKHRKRDMKVDKLVHSLKNLCQTKRPGIEVEIRRMEGKEKQKGPKIVEEANKEKVSLLVVGQEKKPSVWRLFKRWAWRRRHGGLVEYCLQNANCMTIAVKRKSRKLGGYLITTKRHNNFWLLA
ncbi:PREDICTED: uncharacterized protein LOC104820851 [Tarenaya hassleriana]|uniref:uncharacterized protein LOC104820851 n=1 Tax=Tarenaya hassleriana TaxID=28532 RepID=UPI00053C0A22|nr:PREDICTED: uncharacterized protein LOC104820851 [Tarenaya hassleriana]